VHGPTKPSCMGAAGQSTAGTDVAVSVTESGLAVITSANARKQHANRESSFGPTCRLVSSPEAGPGATVGTLK
jgi:protein subunit release factor A